MTTQQRSAQPRSPEVQSSHQENAAAWQSRNPPTTATATADSKRNDAATLAQSLALSGPWSDRIFAGATAPVSSSTSERPSMGRLRSSDTQPTEEPDPPPAYSPSEVQEIHEMPAELTNHVTRMSSTDEIQQPAHEEPSSTYVSLANVEQSERSPLLEPPSQPSRKQFWCGSRKGGFRKHRKAVWLVTIILICMIFIGCAVTSQWDLGDTYWGHPKPSDTPPKRNYEQHEKHSNITGTFRLYDLLDLSTATGNIDVEIEPMSGKKPAVMRLASKAGSIKIRMSSTMKVLKEQEIEKRQFDTSIDTEFGHISGQVLLGNGGSMNVSSHAGGILLEILAVGVGPFDEISMLSTESTFGDQNITVRSFGGASPVSNLRSRHHAFGTGSLDISYPSEWIGRVHAAATGLGDVRVSGDDLTFESKNSWEINAYRGSSPPKKATVKVESAGTGSAWFTC